MIKAKAKTSEKVFINCSSNMRQTNAYIFGLLRSTDTKQTFSNSSCYGDHGANIVSPVSTFLYCVTSVQNFISLFVNIFINISPMQSNSKKG